jgi:hypothetical protein
VHAQEGLQQRRQSRRQSAYGGERKCKIASPLSLKASAQGRERASRAWEKKEEAAARAGGGGGFPGEEASAVVDCRRCHLIDSVATDSREGSTGGWRSALRPPSPAAELPRATVSMADCCGHEATGQRAELPADKSCGGGVDWSSPWLDRVAAASIGVPPPSIGALCYQPRPTTTG